MAGMARQQALHPFTLLHVQIYHPLRRKQVHQRGPMGAT